MFNYQILFYLHFVFSCLSPLAYGQSNSSLVNSISCNAKTYVYEGLVGVAFTPSDIRDKFGVTAGGIGSSAAIDPRSWQVKDSTYTGTLWALPDRGWNTEGTLNFQPRIHKFAITFTQNASASTQNPGGSNLDLTYIDTVLLTDPSGNPVTGLDPDPIGPYLSFSGVPNLPSATYVGDGFGGAGPGGRRVSVDSEGLVLDKDGSFWISDEYGPFIYHFSRAGRMLSAISPPDAILPRRNGTISFSANSPPRYDPNRKVTPGTPTSGRSNNQGLEGLTASPDGKTLYALMQSALTQEGGSGSNADRRYTRFLKYDISNPSKSKYLAEYVVPLPLYNTSSGLRVAAQSEIKYISETQFLILARDSGAGGGQSNTQSRYRHADVFDISSATNIAGPLYDCRNCSIASASGKLKPNITPATYCSFLDYNLNSQLNKFGVHNGGAQDDGLLVEKWESFALVPVHPDRRDKADNNRKNNQDRKEEEDEYFLFSISDNDFITQNGYMDNGRLRYADESGFNLRNQVLVFKVRLPSGSKPRIG